MEQCEGLKIFVVDDDLFCLNIYEQHLFNLGYGNVAIFNNGIACLNSLVLKPDVVLLNHRMDILDGLEVLKKIKQTNPGIYVIFISGEGDAETTNKAFRYGAFDFIVKGDDDAQRIKTIMSKIEDEGIIFRKQKEGFIKELLSPFLD